MEEGSIIHVDYDLYNSDSGELIETTEDVAKREMHQENRPYEPLVCVVGSGQLIRDLRTAFWKRKWQRYRN